MDCVDMFAAPSAAPVKSLLDESEQPSESDPNLGGDLVV